MRKQSKNSNNQNQDLLPLLLATRVQGLCPHKMHSRGPTTHKGTIRKNTEARRSRGLASTECLHRHRDPWWPPGFLSVILVHRHKPGV
jgi:hypothetical protein